MKQSIFLFVVVFACIQLNAQPCIISGQIKNTKDTMLVVQLLYAGAHYRNQAVEISIHKDGRFTQSISLPYPVFALLKYNEYEKRFLLSPGRDLRLLIDAQKPEEHIQVTGTAALENNLLTQLKLGALPFFMQGKWEDNRYAKMPLDSLQENILQITAKEAVAAENKINACSIPLRLKQMLLKEFHYVNQCYLYDLASNYMRWSKNKDQEPFLKNIMALEPLPDSTTLVNCFYANMMVENYASYQLINAGKNLQKDSVSARRGIEVLLQMPFPEIIKQAELYGERYIMSWLYAKHNLPPDIRDKILFNKIMESCDNKLLSIARILADTMELYYPSGHYISMAKQEVDKLKKVLAQQTTNASIKLHSNKKIHSFKELTAAYSGKIIYIDIWGTWCGPCREEMGHVPALKNRYEGKDIAFVYIDMDEDNKESAWKEMVYMFKLEGEHYRLNHTDIQALWREIADAGGEINLYPTYVLFDRNGTLIKANAERPSNRELLYKQVDEVLFEQKK